MRFKFLSRRFVIMHPRNQPTNQRSTNQHHHQLSLGRFYTNTLGDRPYQHQYGTGIQQTCTKNSRSKYKYKYKYKYKVQQIYCPQRKGKGKGLDTCYSATYMSQTRDQQRFTISEVAADGHEPMVPQRIMWPSIARANGQLGPRCS